MKNDQKNPIYPSVPFSCMFEQCLSSVLDKTNKGHLNNHIWSLNLNLVFKPTSFNLLLVALAQNTFILPCHEHASYCALHWLYFFFVAGICSLPVDDVLTMRSMTPMKNYSIFRSARQAKLPCSFRYNPTLSLLLSFTALGQQRFNCYVLR